MGTRRDIRQIEPELKDAKYVLSVALHKSFARSPAYWIDLYCVSSSSGKPPRWKALVQWSFVRQGEHVEGHSDPTTFHSPTQAAEWVEKRTDKKLQESWLFYGLEIDPLFKSHAIVDYVSESVKMWTKEEQPKVTEKPPAQAYPQPKRPKTKAERFQELQRRRKAKAEW